MSRQSLSAVFLRIKVAPMVIFFAGLLSGAAVAEPLNISKEDGLGVDECVVENGQVTYSICYDNTVNDFDVSNILIADALPAKSTFISADGQGSYDANAHTVTWNVDSVAPGAAQECVKLVVAAAAPPGSLLTNQVTITSDETGPGSAQESTLVCPIPVMVDIKPGSCPNPVNVGSEGVLPVAVMGTAELDVNHIDPASITLAGVPPLRWSMEDVATPHALNVQECNIHDCHELGGDGIIDLNLKFETQAVADAIGMVTDRDCLHLELKGSLKEGFEGAAIRGYDVVSILKKGKKTVAPANLLLLKQ